MQRGIYTNQAMLAEQENRWDAAAGFWRMAARSRGPFHPDHAERIRRARACERIAQALIRGNVFRATCDALKSGEPLDLLPMAEAEFSTFHTASWDCLRCRLRTI